jgi:hypothetical protein
MKPLPPQSEVAKSSGESPLPAGEGGRRPDEGLRFRSPASLRRNEPKQTRHYNIEGSAGVKLEVRGAPEPRLNRLLQ